MINEIPCLVAMRYMATKTAIQPSKNSDKIHVITVFYQDPISTQAFLLFSFEPGVQGGKSSKEYEILIKQTFSNYRTCGDTPNSVKKRTTAKKKSTSELAKAKFISFLQKDLENVIV